MKKKLRTITLILVLVLAALPASHAAPAASYSGTSQRVLSGETPAGMTTTEWETIQQAVAAAEYHLSYHVATDDVPTPYYHAPNRAQGWLVVFTERGSQVAPRSGDGWQWGLALAGYGRVSESPISLATPTLSVEDATLTYRWDGNLSEWWINDAAGLEHGFTIQERPAGSKQAPLVVEMAVTGSLVPVQRGDGIHFQDENGTTVLTYAQLHVTDAAGQAVPARLSSGGETVHILVDDAHATYPLTIDPLVRTAKLYPSAEDGSDFFGFSVAVDGNTVVIGAPGDEDPNGNGGGSVYLFEKGSGWADGQANRVAKLDPADGDGSDLFGASVAVSGDTVVVGACSDENPNGSEAGSAYVFEKGSGWADGYANQVAKLDPDDGDDEDRFGCSVAVDGGTIIVGAHWDEDPNGDLAGSAYVFEKGAGWADGHANQVAKLDPADGDSGDRFGASVAVSGDTAVIGAYGDEDPNSSFSGSAYVFEKGSGWVDGHANQVAKLDPDDGDGGDYFGGSVAIDGGTVIVGAYRDEDPNGADAGSAYVFEKSSGWADGHANQVAKLAPDDGDSGDWFGYSVAVDDDTAAVGAYRDEDPNGTEAGSAYVFTKGAGWVDGHANQVAKLDPSDGNAYDKFSCSVAVSGDTVVIGAYWDDPNGGLSGSAYVFEAGSSWADGHANQAAKLYAKDGNDEFGGSVAIGGDTLVAGAHNDESPNGYHAGSAYVFEAGAGWAGGHANQVAKLYSDDGDDIDHFGWSVAISGDTVVVGAHYDDDPNGYSAGSVYIFEKGAGWADGYANQVAKLDPSDGDIGDFFGFSVAVDGDTVVVGAWGDENPNGTDSGSAYVFEKGAGWADGHTNQVAKLDPDDGDSDDRFGYSVAISGRVVVIGATYDEDPNGTDSGSAYVFEKGGGWADGHANQAAKLDPDDGDDADRFGCSVAVDGDTVVVGALYDEGPNGSEAGSAYVFEKGAGWADGHANQTAKLDPDDGDSDDWFGYSVVISGKVVVIGAPNDEDPNGSYAGSAYVFEEGSGWANGHANQTAKLVASDGDGGDSFGSSVAVSSDTVAVGAWRDEDPNGSYAGSAYVFVLGATSASTYYTVTNTNDSGAGSLRQAMLNANVTAGGHIVFDIPTSDPGYNAGTGVWTIRPDIALPSLTGGNITIDGYSQDGAAVAGFFTGPATIVVEIDGTNVTGQNGFNIGSSGNTIKGLAINRFGWSGIAIGGTSTMSNTISGNYIGTDPSGATGLGNGRDGVSILLGANDNTIGGSDLADQNIIGCNGWDGIGIYGDNTTGNVVVGNSIGAYSAAALGNASYGVHIYGGTHGNTVGASAVYQRIAANGLGGIRIAGANTRDNVILSNDIGISAMGNHGDGVLITEGAHDNTIGPSNEITHNDDTGVYISGSSTMSNTVSGDMIHSNKYGVVIDGAQNNTVGGDTESERNVIVGNDDGGIYIGNSAQNNTVSGNYIGINDAGIAWANGGSGVVIGSSQNNTIGGDTFDERNVISANAQDGIEIIDAQDNVIAGNYIGTDLNGLPSASLGNVRDGIGLYAISTGNVIGGATTAEGNLIYGNGGHGVHIVDAGATGNTISHNSIEYNVGEGIELPDSWASFAPVIGAVTPGSVHITGTACAGCTVEVFQSHLDSGEGLTFVGETVADSSGAFTVTVDSLSAGAPYLTATATDAANTTSEFSDVFKSTISSVYLPLVLRED